MKLDLFIQATKNLHKTYYEIENDAEGCAKLHHALEHLFNLAEIQSSVCKPGRNVELFEMAISNVPSPKDLLEAWEKIDKEYRADK